MVTTKKVIRFNDPVPKGKVLTGAFVYGGNSVPSEIDFLISDIANKNDVVNIQGFVTTLPVNGKEMKAFTLNKDKDFKILLSPTTYGMNGEDFHNIDCFRFIEIFNENDLNGGYKGNASFIFDSVLRTGCPSFLIASGNNVRIKLFAKDNTEEDIINALNNGDFYISSGIEILNISKDEDKVTFKTTPCNEAKLSSPDCRGTSVKSENKQEIWTLKAASRAKYLRGEFYGDYGEFALLQPVFLHFPYIPVMDMPERTTNPGLFRKEPGTKIETDASKYVDDQYPLRHGKLLKGNIHTHSTNSDGDYSPEQLVELYKKNGYSFIAITDHTVYTDADKYCTGDFAVLSGVEADDYSGSYEWNTDDYSRRRNYHIGAVRTDYSVKGLPDKFSTKSLFSDEEYLNVPIRERVQKLIDFLHKYGNSVFINHPSWSCNREEDIYGYSNLTGIEIYNNGASLRSASGYSEDYLEYCLKEKMFVFATATDDMHELNEIGGGFIVVSAESVTKEAIGEAIAKGRFYSSTGAEISDFYVENSVVHIECKPCEEIRFIIDGKQGKTIKDNNLTLAMFKASKGDIVRVVITDMKGNKAWTNPIQI